MEKYWAKNGTLQNTSTGSKEATFVILKNYAIALIRKERLSRTNTARRKANRNKFVEKGRVSDKVENLGEVNRCKNRLKAKLRFLLPLRNGLRKRQNLIEGRPSRAETGLGGRENGVRLQKGKVDEIE